jgi:hypothetical protein
MKRLEAGVEGAASVHKASEIGISTDLTAKFEGDMWQTIIDGDRHRRDWGLRIDMSGKGFNNVNKELSFLEGLRRASVIGGSVDAGRHRGVGWLRERGRGNG